MHRIRANAFLDTFIERQQEQGAICSTHFRRMMNCQRLSGCWSELAGLLEEINSNWVYEDACNWIEL